MGGARPVGGAQRPVGGAGAGPARWLRGPRGASCARRAPRTHERRAPAGCAPVRRRRLRLLLLPSELGPAARAM